MMKFLPALLILLMLFSGCTAGDSEAETPGAAAEATGHTGTEAALEGFFMGSLRCFPLGDVGDADLLPLGGNRLLLIRPGEDTTLLTLLEGEEPILAAEAVLPFPLEPGDGSLAPCGGGLSCFDPGAGETVVLDGGLNEVGRIPGPKGLVGRPLLSRDGTALVYCTPDAIRVLELPGGISRILKQTDCTGMQLTGIWLEEGYLSCRVPGEQKTETLLISTHTGETLYRSREGAEICSDADTLYIAESGVGVIGAPGAETMALYPRQPAHRLHFLSENGGALTVSAQTGETTTLEYYDLASGLRVGMLTLPNPYISRGKIAGQGGKVWFLGDDPRSGELVLCAWNPRDVPTGDPAVYTDRYFSREAPDREGLSRCEALARNLGERYGVRIRIYEDAARFQPEGYGLEYEHHVPQLMRALQLLEHCLAQYPPGFLQRVEEQFEGLTICLVRSIREEETGELREGLQFWDGNHGVIALAVGSGAEGAFYHQLCHLVDTVVLNESSAYDTWQSLNPTGFRYDYSYAANRSRNSTAYLQEATRAFVDMFSMSFPREDRARIMEYAMLPGNESLFRSENMQRKLRALCRGIREAFDLTDASETYLWEQYLRVDK